MPDLLGWLTEPYGYAFMQRALLAALLVGAVLPLVGVWIVLRRLAYLGDAMSHATLGGVALAYVGGISLTLGAAGAGLAMAALMALLARHPRLREDTIIGTVEVALFAGGVLLISTRDDIRIDLGHVLFGSITTVSTSDLILNAALGALVLGILAALFGELRAASFDPAHARSVGVRVGLVRVGLLCLMALSVVLALQTVGLLMSIALFVLPPAAARLWTRTAEGMSLLAAAFGVAATAVGLTAAFHLGTAPGATIALIAVALLAVSFAATLPRRGRAPATHAADLATRPGPLAHPIQESTP